MSAGLLCADMRDDDVAPQKPICQAGPKWRDGELRAGCVASQPAGRDNSLRDPLLHHF